MLRSRVQVSAFLPVDMVTLATALEIFNEHDLQPSDRAMDVVEVIHCLTALYERLEEERGILVNVPLCVDMSLNWLLNVFDRYRPRGTVLGGKPSHTGWGGWCQLALLTPHQIKPPLCCISPCSGRSGKMRALSFKTGIACLCGTEVKEKFQCESPARSHLGKAGVLSLPSFALLCPAGLEKQLSCGD